MQRQTPLDTSLRAYSSGGSRGVVREVDKQKDEQGNDIEGTEDSHFMQELKINMMKDEMRDKVEHPQNYGFTSHVLKADKAQNGGGQSGQGEGGEESPDEFESSAEHFVQFMGGNRSFPVAQNLDDRRVRLRCLKEGEVCIYDDQQQKVHIQRNGIYQRSQFRIEQHVIVDELKKDGHGSHKVASRDQTKARSLRLSTILMEPEWITIERTKPKEPPEKEERQPRDKEQGEWQQGGKKGPDNPEKELRKCSSLRMGEKRLTLTTYRTNGDPHLVIDMDEDTSQITLQTLDEGKPRYEFTVDNEGVTQESHERPEENKPGLIFEMDDQFRKILLMTVRDEKPQLVVELDGPNDKVTIKTNGKTEQVFNNNTSTVHIHADTVVKVGDRNANIPCAKEGTVDCAGDRLIADFATKVLVM